MYVFSPVVLISGSSSTACMCAVQLVNSVLTVTVHYLALCCTGVGHELQPALFLFPWGAQQEHILPQCGVNLWGHPGGHQQQWPPLLLRGWWLHQVQTAARERNHDASFYLRMRVIASFISCTRKPVHELPVDRARWMGGLGKVVIHPAWPVAVTCLCCVHHCLMNPLYSQRKFFLPAFLCLLLWSSSLLCRMSDVILSFGFWAVGKGSHHCQWIVDDWLCSVSKLWFEDMGYVSVRFFPLLIS